MAMENTKEEWRTIPGYLGYEVSNLGRVRSAKPGTNTYVGFILKWQYDTHKYPMVHLWINGKRHGIKVHRLVAETFLGPKPTPKHEVAHNDGKPANPRLENLRWATKKENQADRRTHGTHLRGSKLPWARLTESKVRIARELHKKGLANIRIAEKFGVHRETIGHLLRGDTWKHVI